nr:minor capsid protein [uncultured Dysosmobacter sp.]
MITLTVKKAFMPQDTAELLRKFNLQKGGRVQEVIDKSVIDYNLQYAPWETGSMAKSAYAATQIGSGQVRYPGPYAHYMYYGEVYGPNIPVFEDDSGVPTRFFSPPGQKKHPTGRELQYSQDVNPLAGPFWFERMKADHLQDIIQEAKDAAGIK